MINLVKDTINNADIDSLIEWLKTYPRLTKGPLTLELEKQWAQYVGTKYATYVNSGSSANLLALYALMEKGVITRNDKIVVPAVSWATDLSPVFQLGLDPILCDVNNNDLAVDINDLVYIFHTHKPKVLMLVHVLGLVCDIVSIRQLCVEHNVILIEDTCESVGSKYNNQLLGSFGDISTFSFYFGHHISTIEGGMVCTNDKALDDLFRSLRNHGWDRDWDKPTQTAMRQKYNVNEFDALYTFYHSGFNFRSTDLQAFIGLDQLKKVDQYCAIRNRNYQLYQQHLPDKIGNQTFWKPKQNSNTFVSNFAYPLLIENKKEVVTILTKNNIECRPLICGSMGKQPFYIKNKGPWIKETNEFSFANYVHEFVLYVPNHQSMSEDEVIYVCDVIKSVI